METLTIGMDEINCEFQASSTMVDRINDLLQQAQNPDQSEQGEATCDICKCTW